MIRRFGLDLNILHGQVDEIQGRPFGSLAVFARGARRADRGRPSRICAARGVLVKEVAHV